MRVEVIEDLDDPRVAVYRDIKDAVIRNEQGVFVVESRLCVRRLLETGRFAIHSIFVTRAALVGLRDVLAKLGEETPVYLARAEILERVVGYPLHRGCIAVAKRGEAMGFEGILDEGRRLVVALEGVANPENVGNVFRNAVAFGVDAVALSMSCADPLYRKAVRVSMGGSLHTPFARFADGPQAIERLRDVGFTTVALSTDVGACELTDFRLADGSRDRIALTLGAEAEGLTPATLAAVDLCARIPMAAGVDSLNVATASGIALYHCAALLAGRRGCSLR